MAADAEDGTATTGIDPGWAQLHSWALFYYIDFTGQNRSRSLKEENACTPWLVGWPRKKAAHKSNAKANDFGVKFALAFARNVELGVMAGAPAVA